MRFANPIGNGRGEVKSGMNKFGSVADRMHMELGGKVFNSLQVPIP
jgi:hypothetical protein